MVISSLTAKAKNYYTYSASGVKLRTEQRYDSNYTVTPSNATNPTNDGLADYKNTDYAGNIIYETVKRSSTITNKTRILVDGGYWENNVYYFYVTDHLGNNRMVADAGGTAIQRNHYYPFGMSFADTPLAEQGKQPYKYNGKELDQMHGLNMYDNLARLYDPVIPHTPTPDPHAENYYSWSPYAWVGNNPMKYIDPTGMDTIHINEQGRIAWQSNPSDTDVFYIVDANGNKITNQDGSYVSLSFNSKVVNTMSNGTYQSYGYDRYDIDGTKNATSLFEFLADNTTVEWSHGVYDSAEDTKYNVLTTSHNSSLEAGASAVFYDMIDNGRFPSISNHSHPRGTRIPSGLVETGYPSGDVIAARAEVRYIQRKNQNRQAPSYNIYIPKSQRQTNQKYFPYSHTWYNSPRAIVPF
ncbi:JAB-like toxin 1 domain-containing protein [Dysgonomonas termitidis]|uniref:JAB-like toxin 1 domain-containing protein n=1 Tax=Dysgonomonas termitidis TaxID=1516126 RepID=A0ABV9KVC1_9BACT